MAPPGGFKVKVPCLGVEGSVSRVPPCRRSGRSRRGDLRRRTPLLLNPCFVSFPARLTRQLSRLVSLFGGDNKNTTLSGGSLGSCVDEERS